MLFDPAKKQSLLYEVDRFSDTINSRSISFHGLTYKDALTKILEELKKQKDFKENCEEFKSQYISQLNSTTVRWTPKLEKEISDILQGKLGTVEAHALLLDAQKPPKQLIMWRKKVDMSLLPVLTNQPCKLREPRASKWPFSIFSDEKEIPTSILVRSLDGTWFQINSTTPDDPVCLQEPLDVFDAILFSAIPGTKASQSTCFLALKKEVVSIACFGDIKSFASFPHGIEDADFLECYLLPTHTIVVRVGKRNLLTGGLQNEDFFSFRQEAIRAITPCVLESTETQLVETMSKVDSEYPWTFHDTSSCLTGLNNLSTGQSKVLWKQHEMILGDSLLVAVFGHPGSFYSVFYDGTVKFNLENGSRTLCKLKFPISHAIVKF